MSYTHSLSRGQVRDNRETEDTLKVIQGTIRGRRYTQACRGTREKGDILNVIQENKRYT